MIGLNFSIFLLRMRHRQSNASFTTMSLPAPEISDVEDTAVVIDKFEDYQLENVRILVFGLSPV